MGIEGICVSSTRSENRYYIIYALTAHAWGNSAAQHDHQHHFMFHSTQDINPTTNMSTSVWPSLPAEELKKAEDESTVSLPSTLRSIQAPNHTQARELSWLLDSLQDTLAALKSGLEECYALLAPIDPGSTLVMSSARNEIVKGHITRVGTQIVKGVCLPSSTITQP